MTATEQTTIREDIDHIITSLNMAERSANRMFVNELIRLQVIKLMILKARIG